MGFHQKRGAIVSVSLKYIVRQLLMTSPKTENPTKKAARGKAIKVSPTSYELVVAEALRLGVRRGKLVSMQQVIDELINTHLSGQSKPELKE